MKRMLIIALTVFCLSADARAGQKLTIRVHTNGTYSINSTAIPLPTLKTLIRARSGRYGTYPVVIHPEQGTTFSNAWPVMEIAARSGLWRQGFVAGGMDIMFSVPARDRSKSKLSPVMMKGFTGNTLAGGGVVVHIKKGSVTFNGKKASVSELRKQFAEFGATSDSIVILVIVSDAAPMTTVCDILKSLTDAGNKNLALGREQKPAPRPRPGDRLKTPPEE